ncbi:hypothetical protein KNSL1_003391 [Colletotrichum chrysophilum]|nr:hypothetical protein KNSL1_003391 [Colletotrichum chrysophilum]
MQFQSTLVHLKNPPPGYQQPAFDFMGGLEELKRNVIAGFFTRQYDFEVALQYLVYAVNDAHVDLYADDILNRQENNLETPISAVSHINDEPVAEYLARFGSLQSVGMLEPHADWNELMDSPVQDIQGIFSIFAGASTFFPGETITFSFEDPSMEKVELHWLAVYNIAEFTGPLETPGDFYNFFVLGLLPASYYDVPLPAVFGGPSDVVQDDLGLDEGGILTGYFYEDMSTGSATTRYWQSLAANTDERSALVADEWVIATRINDETGNNFTSWEEYEGPRRQGDDDFSLVERYDLKNPSFHTAAFDGWLLTRYLDDSEKDARAMWKPEDVVVVSTGQSF